jgi:hypothetical protein
MIYRMAAFLRRVLHSPDEFSGVNFRKKEPEEISSPLLSQGNLSMGVARNNGMP